MGKREGPEKSVQRKPLRLDFHLQGVERAEWRRKASWGRKMLGGDVGYRLGISSYTEILGVPSFPLDALNISMKTESGDY